MLDDLTKAPVPLKIDGKTYEVSPLTHGDLGQLVRTFEWLDYTRIKDNPDIPQEHKEKVKLECATRKIGIDSPEYQSSLDNDIEARTELAYLSLHHKQPSVTREDIREWSAKEVAIICEVCLLVTNPHDDYPVKYKDENGVEQVENAPGSKKKLEQLATKYSSLFCST